MGKFFTKRAGQLWNVWMHPEEIGEDYMAWKWVGLGTGCCGRFQAAQWDEEMG